MSLLDKIKADRAKSAEIQAPKAEPKPALKAELKAAQPSFGIGDLLIDCLPSDGSTVDLAIVIAPFAATIATAYDVPYYTGAEYGKGPGEVAALLDAYLKDAPVGVMTADSRATPGAVLSVAIAHARRVIRGVR